MIKKLHTILLLFLTIIVHSQTIVINELDGDTPSTDVLEFVELKTSTANMSLNGYVVVFYNGSNDTSYAAYDLDGFTSNVNGVFLLGNVGVSPTPSIIFSNNFLQNGADAVAVYQADATSFPNGTAITSTNLIHAVVYDTNDSDDTGLLTGLGVSVQYNEDGSGDKDNHSLQRKSDGTYEMKAATPGALNDGTGVEEVSITISTTAPEYNEGESFNLTFTASKTLTSDLIINYTLANGSFTTSDYNGNLSVTISSGTATTSTQIELIDDTENEDIETVTVSLVGLDPSYLAFNDNYPITIYDNDFTTSPWGTPINPTYGIVSSTAPNNYYSTLDGKSGQALKDAITAIIADPAKVKAQTYGDVWDMLKEADVNPENNNQIWLVYTEIGRYKSLQQGSAGGVGYWNREHVYPQSRGGFTDGTSTTADGINVYMSTDNTHLEHAHSDAHHLRPADPGENSSRNNSDYGDQYDGPTGNAGSWKGDVARSVMYMTLRYNDLSVVSGNPDDSTGGALGDLDYLLTWCENDVPDDYEMNRNNVIYTWQNNRNPFIDLPELYKYVYGSKTNEVWNSSLSVNDFAMQKIKHTNPVADYMRFNTDITGDIMIYNTQGQNVFNGRLDATNKVDLNALVEGVYFFIVKSETFNYQGKIIKL